MFGKEFLQRYMPGDIALKVIEDEGLYFRRVDGYKDDPTEGERESFGNQEKAIVDLLNTHYTADNQVSLKEAKELANDAMNREKRDVFIQSWFWNNSMSRRMWDSYGSYSINTDCALFVVNSIRLSEYLNDTLPVGYELKPVKYVQDKYSQRDAFFTKNEGYSHESEYRVFINLAELVFFNSDILTEFHCLIRNSVVCSQVFSENYRNCGIANEDLFKYVDEFGFILKAPLTSLIESIFIPCNASKNFSAKLDGLLAEKGYNIRCERVCVPS